MAKVDKPRKSKKKRTGDNLSASTPKTERSGTTLRAAIAASKAEQTDRDSPAKGSPIVHEASPVQHKVQKPVSKPPSGQDYYVNSNQQKRGLM